MADRGRSRIRPKQETDLPADLIAPMPPPTPQEPPDEPKAPDPVPSSSLPTGAIRTRTPKGQPFGVGWAQITRWQLPVEAAGAEFSVPVSRILAHIVIESQGIPSAVQVNPGNGNSYGLLQVVPRWHRALIGRLAAKSFATDDAAGQAILSNPELGIRSGVAVLKMYYDQHKNWDAASSSFFTGKPGWAGADTVNGTRGGDYKRCLNELIAELGSLSPEPTPPPRPKPPVVTDPYRVICGGDPPIVSYGFLASGAGPWYQYGIGHGLDRYEGRAHTGDDLPLPYGTTLYSPIAGRVVCAGTDKGKGAWNTGCSAFRDTGDADPAKGPSVGVGRVEVLAADGALSVIFGHARQCLQPLGATVNPGDPICTVGGAAGAHIHLEVREWKEDGVCHRY